MLNTPVSNKGIYGRNTLRLGRKQFGNLEWRALWPCHITNCSKSLTLKGQPEHLPRVTRIMPSKYSNFKEVEEDKGVKCVKEEGYNSSKTHYELLLQRLLSTYKFATYMLLHLHHHTGNMDLLWSLIFPKHKPTDKPTLHGASHRSKKTWWCTPRGPSPCSHVAHNSPALVAAVRQRSEVEASFQQALQVKVQDQGRVFQFSK